MYSIAIRKRQEISLLLIFTIFVSSWLVIPMPAKAGILSTLGKIAKTAVVTVGSLAAGYGGAVLGMAVGLGPVGMVLGGIGGFLIGKKLLGWATSSVANFATVGGAVAGGLLMAGSGIPLLAAGIIGGALVARGIASLITKLTKKAIPCVNTPAANPEMDKKCAEFIAGMNARQASSVPAASSITSSSQAAPAASGSNVQNAYNRYLAAYKAYMAATQKGDAAAAKSAFAEYQKALADYQACKQ